ncbi:MAG TPA: hypothetical protein VKU02_17725 [Gemmataceae bacterium]|nr:hypothetical protein [Gemmataceae bacterium]
MTPTLLTLVMALAISGEPPARTETPRQPNPLAPSLPLLTDEDESQLDQIVGRFIAYESGTVRGPDAKKVLADFQKLGPESIPALIRGLNRAAKIEHSCPAVIIAKKLARMLNATQDPELLEFARENVGAGVTQSRHMGVIKDLRVLCILRKRTLVQEESRAAVRTLPGARAVGSARSTTGKKEISEMSVTELVEAAGGERGPRLKAVLTRLGEKKGEAVLGALGSAATTYEADIQDLARDLLTRQLSSLSAKEVKGKLHDDRAEVRAAAARAAASKGMHLEHDLIELLADEELVVRRQSHQALVALHPGVDFGPRDSAAEAERKDAQQKWRGWLAKQGSR